MQLSGQAGGQKRGLPPSSKVGLLLSNFELNLDIARGGGFLRAKHEG